VHTIKLLRTFIYAFVFRTSWKSLKFLNELLFGDQLLMRCTFMSGSRRSKADVLKSQYKFEQLRSSRSVNIVTAIMKINCLPDM